MTQPILQHKILKADGTTLFMGKPGKSLVFDFSGRCKAVGGKAVWGDHFRSMIRCKDSPTLILKCKKTGESLHTCG